jgi:dienelactone hydrolase
MESGPAVVNRVDYDAGAALVGMPGAVYPQELEGSVHFPIGVAGRLPILVFLHGRHSSCAYVGVQFLGYPCPDTPATASVDSYKGYDYIAQNLASHGYVVMSIDANGINTYDTADTDAGALARAQTIAKSLDLLTQWNQGTGPGAVDTNLVGRLDFERIGIMGHSRGGEGVTQFIAYNRTRPAALDPMVGPDFGPRYPGLKAVFALAPIDKANQTPTGVPLAELLPYCDGDVSDLSGSRPFERTKSDASPRVQYGVNGADHNFFNTIWTGDDNSTTTDTACASSLKGNVRLSKDEQKANGLTLIAAFLRRFVGPEPAFDPYITGAAPLPGAACPRTPVPCDQEVQVSYIAPGAERHLILGPAGTDARAPAPDGGSVTADGLTGFALCTPAANGTGCPAGGLPAATNRSTTPQLSLAWDGPASLTVGLKGAAADATRYSTLTMRAAANYADTRNPSATTQDFNVVLTDTAGHKASVAAAPYARGALVPSRGSVQREMVLGGIRIPLSAFRRIDLARLASLRLELGARTARGSIDLADIAWQERASGGPRQRG